MDDGAPGDGHAANGRPSPLFRDGWRYVSAVPLDALSAADFALLDAQGAAYRGERRAGEVLRMLAAGEDDPAYGHRINNFRHCLQSATLARRAGKDDEYVAAALLHDVADTMAPETHGEIAAALLAPFVMPETRWMLAHHEIFLRVHCAGRPAADPYARERWRGHPAFTRTAEFAALFDQDAFDPDYDALPLEAFVPVLRRLFARPPLPLAVA